MPELVMGALGALGVLVLVVKPWLGMLWKTVPEGAGPEEGPVG